MQDVAFKNISPRRYYRHLNCYERPLASDNEADRKLIESIRDTGVRQPIIVFNAREENELWLISGHRRLQAFTWGRRSPAIIPAIICDDYDSLFQALLDEQDGEEKQFTKPMTWRNKLELGQILRGVQIFMRGHRRRADATTPGCTVSALDTAKLVGCRSWEWKALRNLACAIALYDQRTDVSVHDPKLANRLLNELDAGTLTLPMVKAAYAKRPQVAQPEPVGMSTKTWRAGVESMVRALELTTSELEHMMTSPNADISVEEFEAIADQLRDIRRTAGRIERANTKHIDERQVTT